jgi:regulator of cell morphogenesis and NO signaling
VNESLECASVGNLVAADSRIAAVFDRFGIEFCCSGRRPLAEACRASGVDRAAVVRAIEALPPGGAHDDVSAWPVDRLIDHIVDTHHAYVRAALPAIAQHLDKIVKAHGARHPELARATEVFADLRSDLEQHLLKEERILFPYIRDLAAAADLCGRAPSPFGTVENPIRMMEQEHREASGQIAEIQRLTRSFEFPEDGCTTYGVCMAELESFEADLHRHVHLENNVLFPRAVALESRVAP